MNLYLTFDFALEYNRAQFLWKGDKTRNIGLTFAFALEYNGADPKPVKDQKFGLEIFFFAV